MGASAITPITMPKWGLTMTDGKVVGWLKREGQDFAPGEEILEIETTKITNTVEASEAGTLRRIVAGPGTTLPVGTLLAVVAPQTVSDAEIEAFVAEFAVVEPAAAAEGQAETAAPRQFDAGGRRLRYLEMGEGAGTPIVMIHGFGADLNSWMFTQPALSEDRRTIALDLPGHGGSIKDVGAGDPDTMADALHAAQQALGIKRAHLAGHSMGGAIAALAALRHPEQAASLTLIASAGLGREINAGFIEGFIGAKRRREATQVLGELVYDPALISRAMVEDMLRYKRLDGVEAALTTIAQAWFAKGQQHLELAGRLAELTIPVQVIWGREDRILPVAHAEAMAARFPVHILGGAGHLPHMEKAAEVNRLIRQFLEN
jgi:pyruvate dehydrogenase E2 component (dihydrolipoamide acetyltransferase)